MLVQVEITRVGTISSMGDVQVERELVDSRSLTSAGTTDFSGLKAGDGLFVTLLADTACFFAIGSGTPSASENPRRYLPAGPPRTFSFAPDEQVTVATS